MGSLKIEQDHVRIVVEWPYGALKLRDFTTATEAIERIYNAVADVQAHQLMADAITYDEGVTVRP